jgi:membrane protein
VKTDLKAFAKRVYERAMEEDITTNSAQVAFYFIFALFPLLLFLLTLFGLILESADTLRQELFVYLREIIPSSAISLIESTLEEVTENSSGGKLTFGAIVALWSASAGIDNIRIALNDVYNLKETRPWWKYKLTSVLLTLGIALLISLALALVFYGSPLLSVILSPVGLANASPIILNIFSFIILGIVLITAFAIIYSFAPNHQPFSWKWITPGSITAIILWIILSIGFRVYLQYFDSYAKTYGSVGAIIVLLLWLYLTALVILIGGVVNSVADEFSGNKDRNQQSNAEAQDTKENENVDGGAKQSKN